MSKILVPMFSSRIFMVLSLTFKSLIHFEFIIVYGVRRWSSFIFLQVSVQFSQHLLNRLSSYFKQLKMELPYDPVIPLLGIYPKKSETLIQNI